MPRTAIHATRLCLGILSFLPLTAQPYPVPAPEDVSSFGAGLTRTLDLLASSTPQHRNTVRILFYGQSITKQDWWKQVVAGLRARYPNANIIAANRAIGGFASPVLRRPMEHDVFPFYPDLVVFHVYGNEEDYEFIIRSIRERTTAEIALQTDHVTWLPQPGAPPNEAEEKKRAWHDRHSYQWLRELAARYACEWMEIRKPWTAYLAAHNLTPKDLLTDGVHLNEQGNFLLAQLVLRHFRPQAAVVKSPVTTLPVPAWVDGRLALDFDGNRVELLASRQARRTFGRAAVRIDGRKPSEFPELYAITRPSDSYGVDWPFVIRVDHSSPLLLEDWELKILETDPTNSIIRFEVRGSRTGPDGAGASGERFVSRSGRVILDPADWWLSKAYNLRKVITPAGAIARWSVIPLFSDTVETPSNGDDLTANEITVAASGLPPGKHRLELIAETPRPPDLEAIRIYRPPASPLPQ